MATQDNVRVYGAAKGAAGIRVVERAGRNVLADPRYGTTMFVGYTKRGPMGIPIPFSSQQEYQETCGDPRDQNWHLFPDGSQLTPDAIDGYYRTGGGAGQLWTVRLDLNGKARSSELTLKNPLGADCLKVSAANEGCWGGRFNQVSKRPIIFATQTTFTLVCPGVEANEFIGAEVEFSNESGKRYEIVGNTEAATSGEVVFTIASQYSLVADGISGPTTLAGTASFNRYKNLAGTINFTPTKAITGAATVNGRVITGVATLFLSELIVGSNLYVEGEARVIESITSDTTATVSDAFTMNGAGLTIEVDNLQITGTTTQFLTELSVGDIVYLVIGGDRQSRTVETITSNLIATLSSGFTSIVSAGVLEVDNRTLTGLTTLFTTQIQAGISYIVDPNRSGNAVKVLSVVSDTELLLEKPFAFNFTAAQITKQSLSAMVTLPQEGNAGLSIEIGQGTKFPKTHFSINVRFNGSLVYPVADCSLDPNDPYFVEAVVNDDGNNIAYRTGSKNYQRWITVESLWDSSYTTHPTADVRPCNGSGVVLALTDKRLYTVGDFDYAGAAGKLLYANPYVITRSYVRVISAIAPATLQGTLSSLGVNVTGTATNFRASLKVGDYLYNSISKTARKIRSIPSDTSLILETAFATNLAALSPVVKVGYLEITPGYDLREMTQVGQHFLVSFPQFLTKGYDGNLAGMIPYFWTKYADPDRNVLEAAVWGKNLGLVRMACPGVSDVVVQKAFASYAEATAFEFRGEIPSNYTSAATAEVFLNQYLGRNDFQVLAFPSYGFISSPFGRGDRLISLSGEIMGGEAQRANLAEGYHRPFAGVDAVLPRVTKLPFDIHPQEEAVLNLSGIQPIKYMFGNCVVYGARGTAISSLYDFLHIRRNQSSYIRQFLESKDLLQQMFKPNQPYTIESVIMTLNNWAQREYRKGAFTQYLTFQQSVEIRGSSAGQSIVADDNTAYGLVEVINGKLRIFISWVPTGIVEELSLNISPDILVSQFGNSLSGSSI